MARPWSALIKIRLFDINSWLLVKDNGPRRILLEPIIAVTGLAASQGKSRLPLPPFYPWFTQGLIYGRLQPQVQVS
jgi:hypothetical protein